MNSGKKRVGLGLGFDSLEDREIQSQTKRSQFNFRRRCVTFFLFSLDFFFFVCRPLRRGLEIFYASFFFFSLF